MPWLASCLKHMDDCSPSHIRLSWACLSVVIKFIVDCSSSTMAAAPLTAAVNWMPVPVDGSKLASCPPGLEYLCMLDQVLAHQVVELLETFTGWETGNKYAIKNSMGQQIYYAFEDSNMCCRLCCGNRRGFTMHVVDNMQKEVMLVKREFKCCASCSWCAGCCSCCSHQLVVEAPPGVVIGSVQQACAWCSLNMHVCDAEGNKRMYIDGPCCTYRCCCDVDYPIVSADNHSVQMGNISKQFSGVVSEYYTDRDNFGVTFPVNLDVRLKATLVGAMFMIDFLEFENNSKDDQKQGCPCQC